MTNVNARFALLQEVARRSSHHRSTAELFGRAQGLIALGSVLVPMVRAQSDAWRDRVAEMTLAQWFELLASQRAYDRFSNGSLSRSAIALGLALGEVSESGQLSVKVSSPKPIKSDGVTDALVTRLKGVSSAPSDALSIDLAAWIDSLGETALAGADVMISEQAVVFACQWVEAFAQAEIETVVDGSVWPAILARLNGSDA